jgi:hypothetical protein
MSRLEVTITVIECVAETLKAILCVVTDGMNPVHTNEVWIPRSVIASGADPDDDYKGDVDFPLTIQKWFADQEDIPYEE